MSEKFLNKQEAAALLGISRPTFDKWIASGRISSGHIIGRVYRWSKEELLSARDRRTPIHAPSLDVGPAPRPRRARTGLLSSLHHERRER